MMRSVLAVCFGLTMAAVAVAQADEAARPATPRPAISAEARAALATGRALVTGLRGLTGPERKVALERAATAHDGIAERFAAESAVVAAASFTAAELWRQQGDLARAERDYLRAVDHDAARFAQRGLFGAADMQRRQRRHDEALATYAKAEAVDQSSARAQRARLWRGRVLQELGRVDEAITVFQAALECAESAGRIVDAANLLALAWIAAGDLEAAARAIGHAEHAVEAAAEDDDAAARERHRQAVEEMSARKALQRARDERNGAAADAVQLDADRRRNAESR